MLSSAGPHTRFTAAPSGTEPYYGPICEVRILFVGNYHFPSDIETDCRAEIETANGLPSGSLHVTAFKCDSFPGSQPDICGVLYGFFGTIDTAGYWLYQVSKHNKIKLSSADSSVEPGNTTTLLARVYDQSNKPVPNINVKLEVTVEANSGGHQHNDNRPKGTVSPAEGSTEPDASGLAFPFTAPALAGDHTITAKCADGSCGEDTGKVWVGVKDLVPLSGLSGTYRLVGDKPAHPGNSYLSSQASQVISSIAGAYQILTQLDVPPTPVLHLNDASLERGGIFDINSTWARPHAEHCRGTVIDVRANDAPGAIPDGHHGEFEDIARKLGADPMWEVPKDSNKKPLLDLRHYHVRLLGGEPGRGGLLCPW